MATVIVRPPGIGEHLEPQLRVVHTRQPERPGEDRGTVTNAGAAPRPTSRSDEACFGQSHLPQALVVELGAVGGRPEAHHVVRKRSRVRRCSTTPNRSATSSESSAPERCWADRTYSLISGVTLSGPRRPRLSSSRPCIPSDSKASATR